ncbi:unnamed protein product [Nyctereutes procyonoides]|uniref:(raccoon dog) hypothetical protein n=1 Tax=Nyctereutes procyonoides TaxID=34880 RepID=A0A811YXD0_NYCPR|nr:unnamed protein product [Nyctereutes procyonoides]
MSEIKWCFLWDILCQRPSHQIYGNPSHPERQPQVVRAFNMEDLGDKAVHCRCWTSKKFPFCDGSHPKHNEETGNNVGPLIIKKKETSMDAFVPTDQLVRMLPGCFK